MADKRGIERKASERRRSDARSGRADLAPGEHPQTLDFRRKNWILFGAGIGCIALGFIVLATGEITLAPVLLLAGYLVLIPWALVSRPRNAGGDPSGTPSAR